MNFRRGVPIYSEVKVKVGLSRSSSTLAAFAPQHRHARRFGGFAPQQHGHLQQRGQGGSGGQNLLGGKVKWYGGSGTGPGGFTCGLR
jgi:hypothetical protein